MDGRLFGFHCFRAFHAEAVGRRRPRCWIFFAVFLLKILDHGWAEVASCCNDPTGLVQIFLIHISRTSSKEDVRNISKSFGESLNKASIILHLKLTDETGAVVSSKHLHTWPGEGVVTVLCLSLSSFRLSLFAGFPGHRATARKIRLPGIFHHMHDWAFGWGGLEKIPIPCDLPGAF